MLLLPLLRMLTSATDAVSAHWVVDAGCDREGLLITGTCTAVAADGSPYAPALATTGPDWPAVRDTLSRVYGGAAQWRFTTSPDPAFTLRLPLPAGPLAGPTP
jgi:hypothetical protein